MDRQCQDRAHRIGQTRDVHIYRFVSEATIEENVLRKARQKIMLDNLVIGEGDFTTEYFTRVDWRDMIGDELVKELGVDEQPSKIALPTRPDGATEDNAAAEMRKALAAAEDQEDAEAARMAESEMVLDATDFLEQRALPSAANTGLAEIAAGENDDELEGTIDGYMLRFAEAWYDEQEEE